MSATTKASGSGTVNPKRKATPSIHRGKPQNKPTTSGKKGTKSSLEITEEDMIIYKSIQAKLKGKKKAEVSSQDEGKLF